MGGRGDKSRERGHNVMPDQCMYILQRPETMNRFICNQENFILVVKGNVQPMKPTEDQTDVFRLHGMSENSSSILKWKRKAPATNIRKQLKLRNWLTNFRRFFS